jgi:hypothetical protein
MVAEGEVLTLLLDWHAYKIKRVSFRNPPSTTKYNNDEDFWLKLGK